MGFGAHPKPQVPLGWSTNNFPEVSLTKRIEELGIRIDMD